MRIRPPFHCPALIAGALYLFSALASAVEYDPNRDDALLACDEIYNSGQIEASIDCYRPLLNRGTLHVAAEAAWALGQTREANELFRRAVADQPGNPHIRARWGRLFLSTHQPSQAVPLFDEALQLDPDYVHAKIGLAAALLTGAGGEARQILAQVAIDHPDSVEALLLLARLQLETRSLDTADQLLDRALQNALAQNVPPLDIYALKATSEMLRNSGDEQWEQKALAINPGYGDVYYIPAHYHLINYRYREAVEVLEKAVAVQPTHWSAHSQLGINLLRLNDIEGAKEHLSIAYEGDPYDTATVNTLRLLDTLDEFEDIDTEAIFSLPDRDDPVQTPIVMRLHRDEADYLGPYVEDLTRRAVETFTRRYRFELQQPLIVELFPNHDDFAVRTVSTPGVGLLGVTFGYLLAMDSPSARAPGEFHWGSTLWHELAHVFTIKTSNHLMPRWFTEGLSVYEEWHTGPLRGRHLPLPVLEAIRDDKLLPVTELDNGFVRPTYPNQVTVSYMQAGLICDLISRKWGHDKLVDMLVMFRDRVDTRTAVQQILGIEPEQLDAELQSEIETHYGTILSRFEEWRDTIASARDAIKYKQFKRAIALANTANEIYPEYVARSSAWLTLHDAYTGLGQQAQAVDALDTWFERGGHDPEMLHQLAHRLRDLGRRERATEVLESINWVAPNNIDLHERLGKDYMASGNYREALREFRALLGLQPHDKSVAHLNVARAHQKLDDIKSARRSVLQALEHAPFFREAQDLLLELTTGDAS
jgi:tetratricopeptide (TPR) repeat protein